VDGARFTRQYFKTLFIPGYEGMPELDLKDYWIDQYEVTNRQFKDFVDQGGYQKREYWKVDFQQNGKPLSWGQALALFRDSTGQPGPKDWTQGEYRKARTTIQSPVLAGTKPTLMPIRRQEPADYLSLEPGCRASFYRANRPASNFGGSGVLPLNQARHRSLGTYDMAGNVKEWIWNEPTQASATFWRRMGRPDLHVRRSQRSILYAPRSGPRFPLREVHRTPIHPSGRHRRHAVPRRDLTKEKPVPTRSSRRTGACIPMTKRH